MISRRHLVVAAFGAALPAAVALAAPAPSASSSAAPLETLPALTGEELPEAPSPPPSDGEWKAARAVRPHRGAPGPCGYRNVREWLEIRCPTLLGAGLVAGDPKGVAVRATGRMEDAAETRVTRVVVPVRRGEAKVLGFLREEVEYNGSSIAEAGTLSILWRKGHADPVLVASGFAGP